MTTFNAVCKQTIYAYKGKSPLLEPSFIEGNTYTFTEKSATMQTHGVGDVSAINERGIESVMTTKHFEKNFRRV